MAWISPTLSRLEEPETERLRDELERKNADTLLIYPSHQTSYLTSLLKNMMNIISRERIVFFYQSLDVPRAHAHIYVHFLPLSTCE
jgi:Xaa-Pro aminopeptidase